MFASSVVYPVDLIGGRLESIMRLNPMTPILEAYRSVLLFQRWPDWSSFGLVAGVSAVLLLWAWVAFHRSEFEFAENV
jgi:ABC-type polysaccharide/polyol phosphate export permease